VNLLPEVVAWHAAGATPIPTRTDGSKAPAVTWRQWEHQQPPLADLVAAFTRTDTDGLGLICGAASGNLEMLELEGRAVNEGWLQHVEAAFDDHGPEWRAVWDRVATGYAERTPSGGLHYYYRVNGPAAPNTKLASRPTTADDNTAARVVVMIETRGQGGFTVVAPSTGRTHKTGRAWEVIAGSRDTIPTLSIDERDGLHAIAATLDQAPTQSWSNSPRADVPARPAAADRPQGSVEPRAAVGDQPPADVDTKPGEDFNRRGTWDFLAAAGWQRGRTAPNGRTAWTRPGKNPADGISATTGGAADGEDRLWVFTSASEFETERPYTRFGAYTWLLHGGDFAAAARALRAEGYGTPPTPGPALTLLHGGAEANNKNGPNMADQPAVGPNMTALATDPDTDPDALPHIVATNLTDTGNGELLVARHGHHLKWVPARQQWIAWDGHRWRPCDDRGEAIQAATDTIRAIPPNDANTSKHKRESLSRKALNAAVDLAATHPAMRVAAENLDANPWHLNTPGGIVDLKTGTIRPTTPADLCTRITTDTPDLNHPAPRWNQYLADTFGNNAEMTAYVQRLAGYSAWGTVTHHVLPFLHGPGGNGKGVLVEVLMALFGDYASPAPSDFLIAGRQDESAIARLAGLRLVVSSEVNQGTRFDEAKVKLLTGGDSLTARFLYGRHFTFRPSHTLWVMGNHQPRVEAGGDSFWRRLRLIPFDYTVPDEKRDENLKNHLINEEGPAIMAWIIRGAIDAATGLNEPEGVRAATADYAAEEDHLGRFVDECIMLNGTGRERAGDVRATYQTWCKAEGEPAVSAQIFGRELRARWNIASTRSHGVRYLTGCLLYAAPDGDETGDETGAASDTRSGTRNVWG
jgi:P4 family phage/plasmid primase-like protien